MRKLKRNEIPWLNPENYTCGRWKVEQFRMPHLPPIVDGVALPIGPGGSLCSCCCPAPGSNERRKLVRSARRKSKKLAIRDGMEDLDSLITP